MARIISEVGADGKRRATAKVEGRTAESRAVAKPTPITSADIAPVKDMQVPPTPIPTAGANLQGRIASQTQQFQDDFNKRLAEKNAQLEADRTRSLNDLTSFMESSKTELGLQDEAYSQAGGVDQLQTELNDINNQLIQEQEALRRQIETIESGAGTATTAQRSASIQEAQRISLRKQADLAIVQLAKQGQYDSAKEVADRAVALQLEEQRQRLETYQFIYQENKELFSIADQRLFESVLSERNRALDFEYSKLTAEYQQKIRENDPAYKLDLELKGLQVREKRQDIANAANVSAVNNGEFGRTIRTAANLVGSEKSKQSLADMSSALAANDYKTTYALIANNVEEALSGENASKFGAARNDLEILRGLKNAIQTYSDNGGDMNLLVGTEEQIKRNLGIDSGAASEIAVQMWREFQTYRVNMTGAAFGAAESRDYASVNPTLGKSLNLNMSIINGAEAQLRNRVIGTIETRVPGAGQIYELASGDLTSYMNNVDTVLQTQYDPLGSYLNSLNIPK